MKLLNELNQISNLSSAQKSVLTISQFSATPKQAFAATTGSDQLVYARDSLVRMGFLTLINGEISLTEAGKDAVIRYNLADASGQPTDDAIALLKSVNSDEEVNAE